VSRAGVVETPPDAVPVVSIVMPAYNAAAHVAMAVQSVAAQTLADWELWVVDDSSTDATAVVVERLAERDRRIRLLRQDRNGGPAVARQRGLDVARARYVAWLDSDDLWLPDKLAAQLDFMRETGAALTFTAYRRISEDGSRTGRLVDVPRTLSYRGLLKHTAIATSTVLLDRARTGPLTVPRTHYDDYALWLALLERGEVAHGLQRDLMRYRVVRGSLSRNKGRSAWWVWRTYRDVRGMGHVDSAWCFAHYAVRALAKYHRF
jgi:teichuronic acid biosynthesis glycosyltransferase TuaG